ncbi:hypothetical protein DER46DRAFT_657804 [Fusarium sp. MPI-SDFR-AT-0072]|nr:hypothetical protein DER46DRAFT_657804 [Fusarium sp. MPI-SDFR-AT-0072]
MSHPDKEAKILLTLQALKRSLKLSLHNAARLCEVHYWALRRRRNAIPAASSTTPKSRKLSDLEEQTIVQFILDLDSLRCPLQLLGKRWAINRELLTSPSGAFSCVVFPTSLSLDVPASRASDIPGSAALDFPYDRHLQPSAARPLGSSWALDIRGLNAPCLSQLQGVWLISAVIYCPENLFPLAASAAALKTAGPRRFVSLPATTRRNRWDEMVQSLLGDRGMRQLPRPQSSVLAALVFFSCEGFPQGCIALLAGTGDLRGHRLSTLGCGKLLDLSAQENSQPERDVFPLTGCPLGVMRLLTDDMLDELDGGAAGRKLC